MKLGLLLLILISSQAAFGQIEVLSINQAYSSATGRLVGDVTNITTTTTTLLGGTSGDCGGSEEATAVCNSCATTAGACNARRIHDNLQIQVTFSYPSGEQGAIMVATDVDDGTGGTQTELDTVSTSGIITAGNNGTVTFTWGEVCKEALGGTGCDDVATLNATGLRIGVDADGNGTLDSGEFTDELRFQVGKMSTDSINLCQDGDSSVDGACNFLAFPGDEKVFIEDVRTSCGFPGLDDSTTDFDATAIRVFYSDSTSFPTIQTSTYKDLEIGSSSGSCTDTKIISLDNNEVDGLTNETQYLFAIAIVDEAQNVGYFTNMSGTVAASTDINNTSACFDPSGAASENLNCHVSTPQEVIGLIEKEFDCFITTATYGTPFRPKVEDFRAFRNQYLHTHWLGRKVIKFYYRNSPSIAQWIRNHPDSKPVMRALLWPLWAFAKACLVAPWVVISAILLSLTLLTYQWRRQKKGGALC